MVKTLYIIPLDKKGKDPALCKSKRPISLLNVAAKILESMAHVRLIRTFEPSLPQYQYAYQRDKGAEFRVTETFEFLAREREAGRHFYLAAVDVESAFDPVRDRWAYTAPTHSTQCRIRIRPSDSTQWIRRYYRPPRRGRPMGIYCAT